MKSVSKFIFPKLTYRSFVRGFTLIELITVMSIMIIVLSLVGPLTINFIDKAQAQSEFIALKNSIKKISYLAFINATPRRLSFDNNQITVFKTGDKDNVFTFNYLNFEKQEIVINSRGYFTPESLTVSFSKKTEKINLFKLVEGEDEKLTR